MDPVQEIKEKIDIVEFIKEYIPIQPAGKNFKALCPFHKEKTPSFMISPERQTWRCFGSCSEGGDVFSFVMKYESVEFYEALRMLAEKTGIELRHSGQAGQREFGVLYDIVAASKDFFVQQFSQNKEVGEYCSERGLKKETVETFELGFALKDVDALMVHLVNAGYDAADIERSGMVFKTQRGTYMDRFRGRLMFPLYNTFGKVIGFSGRIMPQYDDEKIAKYINSPETPIYNKSKVLYGFHLSKQYIKEKREAVLVEGNMDVIMLWQDGVQNAVAISGTALTTYHIKHIQKVADSVIFFFDNDEAGHAAAEKAIDMAGPLDMEVQLLLSDDEKDPADIVLKHPGTIKHRVESETVSAFDFYAQRYLKDISGPKYKTNLRAVLQKVALLYSPLERNRWIKGISKKTGVGENALIQELELLQQAKKPTKQQTQPEQSSKKSPEETLQTRAEKLAFKILVWASSSPKTNELLKEYQIYFPPRFEDVVSAIISGTKNSKTEEAIEYFAMKHSLNPLDPEHLNSELSFLLSELKKEYFKQRRDQLKKQIQELEQKGDQDALKSVLHEFDEIVKLINT